MCTPSTATAARVSTRPTAARGSEPARDTRALVSTIRYPANGTPDSPEGKLEPAKSAGPFPMVVFVHGFNTSAARYDLLLHQLAANGYVVVAPDFPLTSSALPGPAVAGLIDLRSGPLERHLVIVDASVQSAYAALMPLAMAAGGITGHAPDRDIRDTLSAALAALVASGTATLETALVGRPMVIAYKMSPWSWRLMRHMGYLPWIGLPNILARRFVVPEFLQDEATPENLAQALGNLLGDRQVRTAIGRVFGSIHRLLRQDTAQKAADAVLPYLRKS